MAKPKCGKCGLELKRFEVGVCFECCLATFPDGVNGPKMTPSGKLPVSREKVDFLASEWCVSHEIRAGDRWGPGIVLVKKHGGATVQCFIEAASWAVWFKWDMKAKRWVEREERRKAVAA